MKITIISVGKFDSSPNEELFSDYTKRLKWQINLREINYKNSKNLSSNEIKNGEAKLIIENLKPNSYIIALDEHGKQFSSKEFSLILSDLMNNSISDLTFIIGGASGLALEVLQKAKLTMSFGKITLPHLMVRSILAEQLYRAYSIINNHPYHK